MASAPDEERPAAALWDGPSSSARSPSRAAAPKPTAFGAVEWALLVAVALLWGTSFVWIRTALDALKPGVVVFLRVTVGFGTLLTFLLATRGRRETLGALRFLCARRRLPRVVFLAVFWMGLSFYTLIVAQQYIASAIAGMMCGTIPLQVTLISSLAARRTPSRRKGLGMCVGAAGVVCVLAPQLAAGVRATVLGVLMLCAVTSGFAISTYAAVPLQREMAARDGPFGFVPVVACMQAISMGLAAPLAVLDAPASSLTPRAAAAVLVLGGLSTGVAYVAMAALGGRVGAVRGSIPLFFLPLVAAGAGWLIRGEALGASSLLGATLIVAGAALASRDDEAARPAREVAREACGCGKAAQDVAMAAATEGAAGGEQQAEVAPSRLSTSSTSSTTRDVKTVRAQ
jgi:drug/metabolite transporter (DMT)-like permease